MDGTRRLRATTHRAARVQHPGQQGPGAPTRPGARSRERHRVGVRDLGVMDAERRRPCDAGGVLPPAPGNRGPRSRRAFGVAAADSVETESLFPSAGKGQSWSWRGGFAWQEIGTADTRFSIAERWTASSFVRENE